MKESLLFVIFRDVFQFSSVAQSCPTLRPPGFQHARIPHPSPTPRACSNSCPSSWWCHPTISSSVIPFSCLQFFPASGTFPVSSSGGQSIGASASASVSPVNIQSWFPLGWTGLISLLSKGLSRVFSSTTVWKHPFFGVQPSLWSTSYIRTWLLVLTIALTRRNCYPPDGPQMCPDKLATCAPAEGLPLQW